MAKIIFVALLLIVLQVLIKAEDAVPASSDADSVDTSSSDNGSSDENNQTITDSLPLAYSTTTDRDNSMEWIRRLWAFILGVEVRTVVVTVINDTPIQSGFLQASTQGHNVTYTVTVTQDVPTFDKLALLTQFQQLLPASTTSYLVTFPSGRIPSTLNMTLIDQIRGPQTQTDLDQQSLQTFMIYDTISFSYTMNQERDRTLEVIRRSWEQALGKEAASVDLVVHQDTMNTDGTHQITYLITVLSQRNEWNIQQLETKFRQVLSNANIPSLVTPGSDTMGSFTSPPVDNGVRSYVFYDNIVLTYTTDSQRDDAVEAVRKNWEQVLGTDAWNVQVSVYEETSSTQSVHQVSYTIMFSSQNDKTWDFDDLRSQFKKTLPTIKGNGFSVAEAQERSGDDDILFRSSSRATSNSQRSSQQTKSSKSSKMTMMGSSSTGGQSVFNYFVPDGIKFEYTKSSEFDSAMEAIRKLWLQLLGSKATDVKLSINSDFKSANSKKHTIHFHLMIISTMANLEMEMEEIRSTFWSTMSSASGNAILKKAQRLLVLPFITGNLDSVTQSSEMQDSGSASMAESQETDQSVSATTMEPKQPSGSLRLPLITGSISASAKKSETHDSATSSGDENGDSSQDTDNQSQISDQNQSQQMSQFSIEDSRLISYNTKIELEKNLQQLKELWISVLGSDTVSSVKIEIISNIESQGAHLITYRVIGSSTIQIDRAEMMTPFLIALAKAHFSFIANPQRPGSRPIASTQSSSTMQTSSEESSDQDNSSSEDQSDSQQDSSSQSMTDSLSEQDTTPRPATKPASKATTSSQGNSKTSLSQSSGHSQYGADQDSDQSEQDSSSISNSDQNSQIKQQGSRDSWIQKVTASYQVQDSVDVKEQTTPRAPSEASADVLEEGKTESQSASGQTTDQTHNSHWSQPLDQSKWSLQSGKLETKKVTNSMKSTTEASSDMNSDSNSNESNETAQETDSSSAIDQTSEQISKSVSSSNSKTTAVSDKSHHGKKQSHVEVRGSLVIRYRTKRQREAAFAEIRKRWTNSDALEDIDDVKINFEKEIFPQWAQLGPDEYVHEIAFVVTGLTRKRDFDEAQVRHELKKILVKAHVPFLVSAQTDDSHHSEDSETFSESQNPWASRIPSRNLPVGADSKSTESKSQTPPMTVYIIQDQFRITAQNDDEKLAYFDRLESSWQQVFGNETELVEVAIYEDNVLSGKNSKTHDVKYAVVIVSSNSKLDLKAAKSKFAASKPEPKVALIAPETGSLNMSASNAVVLLQTITFSYSNESERNDFISGIEQLWQLALGDSVQLAQVWLYREATIDMTLDSSDNAKTTTTSELSYAVLIVSKVSGLDSTILKMQLDQYLITKMVAVNKNGTHGTVCSSK